ncbi:ACT domain-containing protein [Longispora albida]|uniref:ACT domain-containing protein n=1 Tax=Longispora albida TaxID=203523 RepID=UPI000372E61C|nr:ACT domain-containing protein [Longispora albida]
MAGEKDLATLLSTMDPEVHDGEYVFVTVPDGQQPDGVHPVVTVAEREGLTLVLPRAEADGHGLPYEYVAGWLTLRVHSALDAVGLTAAVATRLAGAGISCNVVAGYFHDHLFVPHADASRAAGLLMTEPRDAGA